jgi:putative hemolysin
MLTDAEGPMEIGVIALCLAFMFFLSVVEAAISNSSPLTLRTMLEQERYRTPSLLDVVLEDKMQVIVPLHLGTQLCLITIAILTTHISLRRWPVWGAGYSFAIILLLSVLFRQLAPRVATQNDSERKLVKLLKVFPPVYALLRSLSLPLWGVLKMFERLHETETAIREPESEDTSEKEMQAYLEIGEDEGIIEKADSELIQSVVAFGDTRVREVMTPRTAMIACPETATIAELRDAMVQNKHSRIPIYRDDLDHIVGIAYIRQLLAEYARGREHEPVAGLVNPALFVPETKLVSALLKELQEQGDHTAIVVDEFGGISGLVTVEDLVEEIVGEIRDEDQAKISDIIEESPGNYIVRGSADLGRVEETLDKRFECGSCSTIAGVVMSYLGRVPAPGEEFDLDGLRIRILDADRKRVHRLRLHKAVGRDDTIAREP